MHTLSTKIRSYILLLISAIIAVTVISGFAIVWMQQQISRTAQKSQEAESHLTEIVRRLGYLDEKIAAIHQPTMLQAKVAASLRPSMDSQVVWVQEDESRAGRSYTTLEPASNAGEMAFINLRKRR